MKYSDAFTSDGYYRNCAVRKMSVNYKDAVIAFILQDRLVDPIATIWWFIGYGLLFTYIV